MSVSKSEYDRVCRLLRLAELSQQSLLADNQRLREVDRQRRRKVRELRLRISELVGERTPVPQKYRSYTSRGEGE